MKALSAASSRLGREDLESHHLGIGDESLPEAQQRLRKRGKAEGGPNISSLVDGLFVESVNRNREKTRQRKVSSRRVSL